MITIACVMRSGGDFAPEHVWALRRGVNKHLTVPHEFRVLTDCDFAGAVGARLREGWPGWWSKIELFRPGLFDGPVLYFDLDTVIVGDLDALAAYRGQFVMLEDFYKPGRGQSGIMAWTPDAVTAGFWHGFVRDPAWTMHAFRSGGDGRFIHAYADNTNYLQDLFPGQIVSYKRDVRPSGIVPADARVVCFHGRPRPWETPLWEDGT